MLRKFQSFILGCLVSIVILEILIRVSYFAFEKFQETANNKNHLAKNPQQKLIKIVTIGESATAVATNEKNTYLVIDTAYPIFLEKYLNQKNLPYQFIVENKANLGGESGNVVQSLKRYVYKNKPDIIIVMMGLNDTEKISTERLGKIKNYILDGLSNLKTIQLYSLIKNELKSRQLGKEVLGNITQYKNLSNDFIENNRRPVFLDLGQISRSQGLSKFKQDNLSRALSEEFLALYFIRIGEVKKAEEILKNLINETGYGLTILASEFQDSNKFSQAQALYEKYLKENPRNSYGYSWLVQLHLINHNLKSAEALMKEANKLSLENQLPLFIAKAKIEKEKLKFSSGIEALKNQCGLNNQQRFTEINKKNLLDSAKLYSFQEDYQECMYLLSELYYLNHQYDLAEGNLKFFINNSSFLYSSVSLLQKVYEAQNKTQEAKTLIKNYARENLRVGEQFALINYLKNRHEQIEMKNATEYLKDHFEDTKDNFKQLKLISMRVGAELLIMQFPTFALEPMQVISGNLSGVHYVDNELIFNNGSREKYFFEPKFPYNFNHFTKFGAEVLAQHVADEIEKAIKNGNFPNFQPKTH
jgi:hypothetical protein